jgi:hypothetical protein
MTPHKGEDDRLFRDAVQGLHNGDFSRLEPLFGDPESHDPRQSHILQWYEQGWFNAEPKALEEAFTCACFLGRTGVADYLLARGVDPTAGAGTGSNGFHWAADRGQLETVLLLIRRNVPLEIKNMYGGTVLGAAVWSAVHETRANHIPIIEALIRAGARLDAAGYPTGNERVDEVLRRHGAPSGGRPP